MYLVIKAAFQSPETGKKQILLDTLKVLDRILEELDNNQLSSTNFLAGFNLLTEKQEDFGRCQLFSDKDYQDFCNTRIPAICAYEIIGLAKEKRLPVDVRFWAIIQIIKSEGWEEDRQNIAFLLNTSIKVVNFGLNSFPEKMIEEVFDNGIMHGLGTKFRMKWALFNKEIFICADKMKAFLTALTEKEDEENNQN
jgi:hypothetical protein